MFTSIFYYNAPESIALGIIFDIIFLILICLELFRTMPTEEYMNQWALEYDTDETTPDTNKEV